MCFSKFLGIFSDGDCLIDFDSFRKHLARHRKDHVCKEDDCDKRFGTLNDLERHRKSVHNKCPLFGPKEKYKCFGRNCRHPEKEWPRLDNFRAHLRRQHSDENEEDLVSQYVSTTSDSTK